MLIRNIKRILLSVSHKGSLFFFKNTVLPAWHRICPQNIQIWQNTAASLVTLYEYSLHYSNAEKIANGTFLKLNWLFLAVFLTIWGWHNPGAHDRCGRRVSFFFLRMAPPDSSLHSHMRFGQRCTLRHHNFVNHLGWQAPPKEAIQEEPIKKVTHRVGKRLQKFCLMPHLVGW